MTRTHILRQVSFLSLALAVLIAGAVGTVYGASGDQDKPKLADPFAAGGESRTLSSGERYFQREPAAPGATWNVPGDFATIQAAIDGAGTGDIINVAAGTWAEALLIDGKDLTIQGAGAGSSIITGTSGQTQYIVRITNGAVVDLSGFTIDGTGIDRQYGIYADAGSSGDIHDNEIKNVSWPGAMGLAIRRQECYISVTDNVIYGFGRIGIYTRDDVIGNTDTGVISGNTVTGLGAGDPDRLSYGISVYSGNPTVDDNEIYDCLSGANVASWASAGLDIWTGATSAITNNDFYNCEIGILSNSASPTMSGNTFTGMTEGDVRLDYFVKGNPTPHWAEYYNTIQEAINAIPVTTYPVIVWIGVYSGGGTYPEAVTVDKSCHIWGYSRAAVLLDVEGYSTNNAGVYINADDVLISGFTLEGNNAVSVPRYGVKFGDNDGCYLDDAEIRNVYRSGMDALGATNLSISSVEVKDTGGNGIQICDCTNVTFEDVTTSNNAWGGVGIFTYGQYTPIGTSGVVFTGTNSFGETVSDVGGIYLEAGNYADPPNPYPITYSTNILDGADVTVQLADVTHTLKGESDNDNEYTRFYASLTDAQNAAAGTVSHILGGRYITELAGTDLYVPSNLGSVAAAAAAANAGDVVHIDAGTYEEQVEIDRDLVLQGAGAGLTEILSPVDLSLYFGTNYPVVYIHDADDVELHDLTVDGAGRGNANYRFVGVGFSNAGGGIYDCDVLDIRDTPFSGAQHGVAVYAYNTDGSPRTIDVQGCTITGFQKNAMALNANDTTPLTVDVSGNTITGAGATDVTAQNGVQVWATAGSGNVADNTISGIGYDNTAATTKWVASSVLSYWTPLTVTGNTISGTHVGIYQYDASATIEGNDLSIEKIGVSAYGIIGCDPPQAVPSPFSEEELPLGSSRPMLGAPAATLAIGIAGNTVAFSGTDNTATYGIELDAGYGPDDLAATVDHNGVTGFEAGIEIWACETDCDTGVFTSVEAHYNSLTGNTYGMRSNADYLVADGTMNWWGDASGPHHPSANPYGTGDEVSDDIDFDPWLGAENLVSVAPAYGTTNCDDPVTFTFWFDHAGTADEVRGVDVTFQVDPAVVTVGNTTTDIVEGTYLPGVGSTTFFALDLGGGVYRISTAILGGTTGATGSGDLFAVDLTPVAEGLSAITITDVKVRDVDNAPLTAAMIDGEVRIDCTDPTMEPIAEAEDVCYNAAPTFSNFGFDDDQALDLAEYQIDADGWLTLFSGIDLPEWNSDGWALPGFAGLSEGSHTVYFRVKDMAGNWNGEGDPDTYSWSFIKDTVPPDPPTGFTAMPGHNRVHLAWTNPTGDPSFEGVEIRLVAWGDYPQYLTAPSYPADHTGGTPVTVTALEAFDDDPRAPRDIYYYAAFSYDCAGNYSAFDAGAADRSTSYWLGDIYAGYDGYVNFNDLGDFSNTFGVSEGGPGWNAEADFGPTDDWSRFGIPLPDDVIDFEDLMIFSMNFGNVDPAGFDLTPADRTPEDLANMIAFDLVPSSDENGTVVSVMLSSRAKTLKGARLLIEAGDGCEIASAAKGEIVAARGDVFFGTIPSQGGLELCIAALGVEKPLAGSGEIAKIHLRGDGAVSVSLAEAEVRDLDNRAFEIEGTAGYEGPEIPVADALGQNFPNPFNPATTVAFDLARPAVVRIGIYDVSGRLVRTLVDGSVPAGRHEIAWNGVNNAGIGVPSGLYFYRMTTSEGFTATRKMILLR